jgi:hypothetical protein
LRRESEVCGSLHGSGPQHVVLISRTARVGARGMPEKAARGVFPQPPT